MLKPVETFSESKYMMDILMRLSHKELLEGLIRTMHREGIVTDTFDGKLWLLLVEKATVGTDGKLTFTLRNGMEIEA